MKFLFDYVCAADGSAVPLERQLELARAEFRGANVTISVVDLDQYPVSAGGDFPFATRSFPERAIIIEVDNVGALCQFASDSGRVISLMEASAWASMAGGETLLRYRLIASRRGHCDDIDSP